MTVATLPVDILTDKLCCNSFEIKEIYETVMKKGHPLNPYSGTGHIYVYGSRKKQWNREKPLQYEYINAGVK